MVSKKSIIIFFSLSLLICRIIGTQLIAIYDDAFITYRYAENFADGFGFVYNQGEWFLGVTTPVFAFICSFFSFLGLPLTTAVLTFNILIDSIILIITIYLLIKNGDELAAYVFSFLYIISPIAARICAGGMEMNLFILLTIFVLILYSTQKKYIAFILAGLLYFVRPEAVLIILILTIEELITFKKINVLIYPFISALMLVIPTIFIYFYYGQLLPQSVIAKAGLENNDLYAFFTKLIFNDFVCLVSFPLTIIGLWKFKAQPKIIKYLGIWAVMIIASYLISQKKIWTWYGAPIHYVFFVFAAIGLAIVFKKLFKQDFVYRKFAITGLAILPVLFWISLFLYLRENPVEKNIFNPLKEYCSTNGISKKDTIFANDIGAIGYYSKAYIFDSESLISNAFSKYNDAKKFVRDKLPPYLFLNLNRYNIVMVNSPELKGKYIPVKRFSKTGKKKMIFNTKKLNDLWIQDYILYKRVLGL